MENIFSVHVVSSNTPSLLPEFCRILAKSNAHIVAMSQSAPTRMMTLQLSFRLSGNPKDVLEELDTCAQEVDANFRSEKLSRESDTQVIERTGNEQHVVTLIAKTVTSDHLVAVTNAICNGGLHIVGMHRLSQPLSFDSTERSTSPDCLEIYIQGTRQKKDILRAKLLEISTEFQLDVVLQEETLFRRHRRLIVFDMDSTLIQAECIDELAREAGAGAAVAAITERAMRGELDFRQSLRQRLSLLKGLNESVLQSVAARLPLTEGAEILISTLKKLGYKIAILSGGFTYFGNILKKELGVDYIAANELEIIDGKLTGNVVGDIVDAEKKAELLQEIAAQEAISLEQVIAVGDGANDLLMLHLAGLGVAFHAKPKVKKEARQAISFSGLDSILYLLGLNAHDIDSVQKIRKEQALHQ